MKPKRSRNKEKRPDRPDLTGDPEVIRLNKYVARCGLASRRKSAEMIKNGLIKVNGEVERNPAYRVQPKDNITYRGKTLNPEEKPVYILLNKPKDVITTVQDERGRKTVMDLLRRVPQRLFPVGRLDRQTTGLLLLTNDGDLAQKLSHPSREVKKIYHVVLDKKVKQSDLEKVREGLDLEDGHTTVDAINYIQGKPENEIAIELHSGKNRIVRRIFEHQGFEVVRLDRTYYAGLTKKDLPRGRHRHLSKQEIIMLKHFT